MVCDVSITDALCGRRGIFSKTEQADVHRLLRRLARLGLLMMQPHVFTLRSNTHGLDLRDQHSHIVAYCVQHELPMFLYVYSNYWR